MFAVNSVIWENNISSNGRTCIKKFIYFSMNLFCKPPLPLMIFIRVCYGVAAQKKFSKS